jgi:AcrR family transcriptional regulator
MTVTGQAPLPRRKPGRPSNETRAKLGDHIIDSAWAVFVRSGFTQATIQEICSEANISLATFYRYFPNKNEIFRIAMQRAGSTIVEQLRIAETAGNFEEALMQFAEAFTYSPARGQFGDALSLLISEARRFPDLLGLVEQPSMDWIEGIQALIRRDHPRFTKGEALDLAFLFIDMIGARVSRERALNLPQPNPEHAAKRLRTAVRVFVTGLDGVGPR